MRIILFIFREKHENNLKVLEVTYVIGLNKF